MNSNLLFILLPPLFGFLINGVMSCYWRNKSPDYAPIFSGTVATVSIFLSFAAALFHFFVLQNSMGVEGDVALSQLLFKWFFVDGINIDLVLRFDHISSLMCLIITGIGALIHLYSIGYMAHDKGVVRYFAYLNLFVFFMLILVLGDSLPVMFIGWEGVGLCSYLLIGFWFEERQNILAANKAFIVNRIGDCAFLIGMFLIFNQCGTLKFSEINNVASSVAVGSSLALSVATLLLFIGATGKSAQVPLYVWLPDAMAGPTPVSALIHAATMVTAGVYLIIRLHPLFLLSPSTMQIIAIGGCLTAFIAATMALVQNDIKKVLAYSTISQLGFMFLACGVGAFSAAMFHLITHAFFKALLFLGAGSVIHACSGEQDMKKMGGLRKKLPHTHVVMLIGSLALAGIAPLAGFFSKDEILYSSLSLPFGSIPFYLIAQLVAVITAIYTSRMLVLTFYSTNRSSQEVLDHLHESPAVMLIPLYILAFFALSAGALGLPHFFSNDNFHVTHLINSWLSSSVIQSALPEISPLGTSEAMVSIISIVLGLLAFIFSCLLFQRIGSISEIPNLKTISNVWQNLYGVDKFYKKIVVDPLMNMANLLYRKIDRSTIDGFAKLCSTTSNFASKSLRSMQNGQTQTYAMLVVVGLFLSILLLNWNQR